MAKKKDKRSSSKKLMRNPCARPKKATLPDDETKREKKPQSRTRRFFSRKKTADKTTTDDEASTSLGTDTDTNRSLSVPSSSAGGSRTRGGASSPVAANRQRTGTNVSSIAGSTAGGALDRKQSVANPSSLSRKQSVGGGAGGGAALSRRQSRPGITLPPETGGPADRKMSTKTDDNNKLNRPSIAVTGSRTDVSGSAAAAGKQSAVARQQSRTSVASTAPSAGAGGGRASTAASRRQSKLSIAGGAPNAPGSNVSRKQSKAAADDDAASTASLNRKPSKAESETGRSGFFRRKKKEKNAEQTTTDGDTTTTGDEADTASEPEGGAKRKRSRLSLFRKSSKVRGDTTTGNEADTASEPGGEKKTRSRLSLFRKSSKVSLKTTQSAAEGGAPRKAKKKRSVLGRLWNGKNEEPAEDQGDTTTENADDEFDDGADTNLNFTPDAEDLSQEQMRQQCLRLLSELENLYNSSTIENQVDHYRRLNEFLDGEIKMAVKTAEQIQVAVEKYEDEKLAMADRLGVLYKEAIRQRRLAKAIDIKERYAKLMEDSEEGKRVSAMQLDQVDWNEELRNDYKFWIKQWERDEIRFAKEEELLAEDYKHQSAEYYEMKAVTDKATRQMREVQEEFRVVVDGYRGQLSELKEKMLEVIKRERARHHFLQERLERRESERATRYEVLQEIRDKAVKATYNVHTRFANYIMQVKNRWKIAEADLEKLATSKKGKVTLSPEAQELIAELKIFNPRRLERIKNDLNSQVEQLRNRLRETLKQKRPLVAKRAEMLRRMREEKDSKAGSEARSEDSGFTVHPMKLAVSGTSNYEKQFEREQFYLDTEEDRKLFEDEREKETGEKDDFYTASRKQAEAARRDSQSELEKLMTGTTTAKNLL